MNLLIVTEQEIRRALHQAEENLREYKTQHLMFQVGNETEVIARCYRLLGDNQAARQYFTQAAWANLEHLKDRRREGEVEIEAQWVYTFEALWLYYQAGNQNKTAELCQQLRSLIEQWPEPIPLRQRIRIALACYVAGDFPAAMLFYERFELRRYETTQFHPEVKLLKAGLYGDAAMAERTIQSAQAQIQADGTKSWYANRLEYDLIAMAQALVQGLGKRQ